METGGGGGEVSQAVTSPGQSSSARGVGRWQRHPVPALPGGYRAGKLMSALTRGGVRVYIRLEPEPKMEIPAE